MATSIGHLALILGVQSSMAEDLAREEKRVKQFAGQAKKDLASIGGKPGGEAGAGGSIAGGVLGFMAGGPIGQILGGASPMGVAIGIGIQKVREQLMAGARDADVFAQRIRDVEQNITSAADRAMALRVGLLPDDAERIKQADNEIKKLESSYDDFKRVRAEVVGVMAAGANEVVDGFRRDVLGLATMNADALALQREQQKQVEKFLADKKQLTDSFRDERMAIGKTAAEVSVLKLQRQGLAQVEAEGLLRQAKEIEQLKEQADLRKKLADDLKGFEDDTLRRLRDIGKSPDMAKLDDLLARGADPAAVARMRNFADQAERMQAAFGLVEPDQMKVLMNQLEGLRELADAGRITAQQMAAAEQKARNAAIDKGLEGMKLPAFLERGSTAEVQFRREQEGHKNQEALLERQIDHQEKLNQIQADAQRALRQIADNTADQIKVMVLGV